MTTKHTDPQREAMGALNYKQSYARYDATKKRRENWGESVERVMAMHREHLGELADGLTDELGLIEQAYKERRILGSQRSLQFGGQAILDKHPRSYNCTSCYVDDTKRFSQALYLLLCGAGVGYSVQRHHVAQLPNVISAPALSKMPQSTFIIEDTIEGWCDALDALVSAYFGLSDQLPSFSFDLIRPEGSAISSCGGKAPGPYPLRVMLSEAERLLRSRVGQPLRPCDASDLMCIAADCVRAGGVRRSALLCMFSPDDEDMIAYKSVDQWWATHPYRARANISAMIERSDPKATQYFEAIFEKTRAYGEPATIWCESTEVAYNPCVAPDTLVLTDKGYRRIKDLPASTLMLDPRFGKGAKGETTSQGGFLTSSERQLYRLQTKEGYWVECTEEHEIMTQRGWVRACDLDNGDSIHIANIRNSGGFGEAFTQEQGAVLGWLLGDGCVVSATQGRLYFYGEKRALVGMFTGLLGAALQNITEQEERTYLDFSLAFLSDIKQEWSTETKRDLPDVFFEGSELFLAAFMRALFTADGSVQGDNAKGLSVRLTQNSLALLDVVQRVLLQFGVFSKLYKERRPAGDYALPNGKGGQQMYSVKAVHELMISRDSLNVFSADIGFYDDKQGLLSMRLGERKKRPYADRFVAKFESFTPTRLSEVYDLTQPDTSSFIANGVVVHNCVEIGMVPLLIRDPQGEVVDEYSRDLLDPSRREQWRAKGYTFETAFQFCNLTEVNVAAWASKREAYEAVELATILGCIQASYTLTDDDYLAGTATQAILEREYLCGVSLTGLGSAQPFARDARFLGALGAYAADTANAYFERCGLKKAPARVTCVKPSGNAAVLLGVSSGVHAEHAPRFIRRMQQPKNSPIVQAFASANPQAVEDSVWSALGTDYAVSFAIETPPSARLKTNETAEDFLRWVSAVQGGWVKNGTLRPESVEGLTHNVSNTCVVHEHEWDDVKRMLLTHRAQFGGVSCLSASGDYDYPQAPFQRVSSPHEIEETDPHREAKIAAWELWNKLRESYVEIDYDAIIEEDDNTELMGEVACAGGACELTL